MDSQIEEREHITVFWDFESTLASTMASAISTYNIVKKLSSVLVDYGTVTCLRVYWDYSNYPIPPATTRIRSELSASGACLIDCPSEGRNEGARKKMLVDLLFHAWERPTSHTYAIITGDRDVALVIAALEMRGFHLILLSPAGTHPDLTSQSSIHLDWNASILNQDSAFDNIYDPNITTTSVPFSSQFRRGYSNLQQDTSTTQLPRHSPRGNPVTIPSGLKGSGSSSKLAFDFSRTRSPFPQSTNSVNAAKATSTPINLFTPPVRSTYQGGTIHESIPTSPLKGKGRMMSNFTDSEKFEPFDEDQVTMHTFTRRASVMTVSSSSSKASVDSRFSLVQRPEPSTAPTSAEEPKVVQVEEKTSVPAVADTQGTKPPSVQPSTPLITVANNAPKSTIPIKPVGESSQMKMTSPERKPASTSILPTAPKASPAKPSSLNQSPQRSIPVGIPTAWLPLVTVLRKHGGKFPYLTLPTILLKEFPSAYKVAGVGKYTNYIETAIKAGVIRRVVGVDGNHTIHLTSTYML